VIDHCDRLSTTATVNDQLGLLLRIRQQHLTNHQYLSLPPDAYYHVPAVDEVQNITSVQLFLEGRKDCTNAGSLLGRMTSVTSLAVTLKARHFGGIRGGASETGREVVTTLFPPANANPLRVKLRRIRIESMSFRLAGVILPNVVPLDSLKHLYLLRYSDTDHLCESLSRLSLALESFCDERSTSPGQGKMEAFITSLGPLQEFRVTAMNHGVGEVRLVRSDVSGCWATMSRGVRLHASS
jgi:hypothetical protein